MSDSEQDGSWLDTPACTYRYDFYQNFIMITQLLLKKFRISSDFGFSWKSSSVFLFLRMVSAWAFPSGSIVFASWLLSVLRLLRVFRSGFGFLLFIFLIVGVSVLS